MLGINTILICHSTALHRIKYKWPVSVQTMTVWCFSMLWNRVFETSVRPWKYNLPLIFLCSSFLLLFFYIFLLFCPYSFVKLAQCRLLLPPEQSASFVLRFLFSLPCQFCIFEQLIKTQKANMIFSFSLYGENGEELIWPQLVSPRAIDLIRRQKKERTLTWEVRATSPCRNYFYFINDKGKIEKD